ncbi:MAG TPA: ATPase, T2SS/T4P/T4SS family, partial [Gammaproteobacteria bacterium]|nr:ATPase, T2SS/T4P/T4SS family [Gammaproteobacteria bacterium]
MHAFAHIAHISDVILYAYQQHASDLHFEPGVNEYRIRMRQHGLLRPIFQGTLDVAARITTQLKVMAQLDIAEQRLPQDGRISFMLPNAHALDIRISTCPTLFGEKIVLRLLDSKTQIRNLDELGLSPEQKDIFLQALARPQGLILVTGPTGSGKTTTLYTALQWLNQDTQHIVT